MKLERNRKHSTNLNFTLFDIISEMLNICMVLFLYFSHYLEQYLVLSKYGFSVVHYSSIPLLPQKQFEMCGSMFACYND